MKFETFWPALFLLIIPYLWLVPRRTELDLSPKHLGLSTIIRSVLVCLLALALMQPVLLRSSTNVSAVYLLDVSQSVSPAEIRRAIEFIRNAETRGRPDHSQFVAFGANSMAFDTIEDLRKVQVSTSAQHGALNQAGTDIAGALGRAARIFAPHHLKRIVLLSDGNDNSGELAAILPRLNRDHVRVYTVPLEARTEPDVWIESMAAPPAVTAEEQFPIEVNVFSDIDTVSNVELRNGSEVLGSHQAHLVPGLNHVDFDTRLSEKSNTVVLTAAIKSEGDAFPANNIFRQPVVVKTKPRVLYIESHAPSVQYLQKALTTEGLLVDVMTPQQLPAKAASLDPYDAVILSDVDPKSISPQQMGAIETYVRELGGGFLMAGGENIYGKDGYSASPIEKTLPVTFDTKKKPPTIAMVAVIDVSGSMSGGQLTIAKEAAKAPLKALRNSDRFGVLSFNTGYNWAAPLQSVANRDQINTGIETLYAGGGTNIYVGLNAAYQALKDAPDEVKTVLLLSDGITQTADYQRLTTAMIKAGINVSSISVGLRSNRELMADIAMWGKGRAYYIDSYDRVPQIFIKETELALGKTLQEQPFLPAVKKNVDAFKGIDFNSAPRLLGYVVTKAKPTSEVLLADSWAGEPLLARWQYGLGKSAMFTSDVKTRWAAEWIGWSGYSKFWSQVVRETMRRRTDESFDFNVVRTNGNAVVSINAVKDGRFVNDLQPQLRIIGPDQKVSSVSVPQAGPGAYETRVRLDQDGTYAFRASGKAAAAPTRYLEYSYPAEYHFYPADTRKLRSISAATGGKFQPEISEIFDPHGETTELPIPFWPWLAGFSAGLYIVDILLRRLRLFAVP